MDLDQRNEHLDKVLGLDIPKTEETIPEDNLPVVEEDKSIVIDDSVDPNEYKNELLKNKQKMEMMFEQSEEVLDASRTQASSFATPRDIEVYSTLLGTLLNVQKEISVINEKMYKKEEVKDDSKPSLQQNNIYVGTIRELLEKIDENK